jgi:hypothetical protein
MRSACGFADGQPFIVLDPDEALRQYRLSLMKQSILQFPMKKILIAVLFSVVTSASFGQGQALFKNLVTSSTPSVNAPIYLYEVGGQKLDSAINSLWRAAMLGGPTTATSAFVPGSLPSNPFGLPTPGSLTMTHNANNTGTTWVGFRSGTSTAVGAGIVAVGSSSTYVVPDVGYGGQALLQVVAWQGNYTDWASAFAAAEEGVPGVLIGASNPLIVTLTSSLTDTNIPALTGLESFAIVVPEPSSLALAVVVTAAMMVVRRRR